MNSFHTVPSRWLATQYNTLTKPRLHLRKSFVYSDAPSSPHVHAKSQANRQTSSKRQPHGKQGQQSPSVTQGSKRGWCHGDLLLTSIPQDWMTPGGSSASTWHLELVSSVLQSTSHSHTHTHTHTQQETAEKEKHTEKTPTNNAETEKHPHTPPHTDGNEKGTPGRDGHTCCSAVVACNRRSTGFPQGSVGTLLSNCLVLMCWHTDAIKQSTDADISFDIKSNDISLYGCMCVCLCVCVLPKCFSHGNLHIPFTTHNRTNITWRCKHNSLN